MNASILNLEPITTHIHVNIRLIYDQLLSIFPKHIANTPKIESLPWKYSIISFISPVFSEENLIILPIIKQNTTVTQTLLLSLFIHEHDDMVGIP